MGQCGCGESVDDRMVLLPNGNAISFGIYRGCEECFPGPAFSIHFYDTAEHAEHFCGYKAERITPDEFGGNDGAGIGNGLFEVCDLVAESKKIGGTVGFEDDEYATIQDWLEDNGFEMIRGAMERFEKRTKKAAQGEGK